MAMDSLRENTFPGKLFIVEGIDGSGKSTQLDLLHKWLLSEGYLVVFTEWNSSPIVKGTTRRGKQRRMLTPVSFSLIHAADFASRLYMQVIPALQAGAIVLADRYAFTAFARDGVRGLDRAWLRKLYAFAVEPTIAFYFDVPLDEAIARILKGRPSLKYYEAGLDLDLSRDPSESFRLFQGLIKHEYDHLAEEYRMIRVDATQPLVSQQQVVRQIVRPYLDGAVRMEKTGIQDALKAHGLSGRYLDEVRLRERSAE
jgi:dTMP kinase